jgi:hypothetical protein
MLDLVKQLAVAAGMMVGFGHLVFVICGGRKAESCAFFIWCLLGGICAQALLVQTAFYCGVSVGRSAWFAAAVAAIGLVWALWTLWSRRTEVATRPRLFRWCAILIAAVSSLQGLALIGKGPGHYFGRGEYDQANYVAGAQFMMEHGGRDVVDISSLHPWLVKGQEVSQQRITQSVVHAEIAVLSGTDAQSSWGATTLLFVNMLGLSVLAALLSWGAPLGGALLGAGVAAVLPAVTEVNVGGFFSQLSVLWVAIALPCVVAGERQRVMRWLLAGVFLGFALGAYTEVAPIFACSALIALLACFSWRTALRGVAVVGLVCLALNAGYLGRAGDFFVSQLQQSQKPGWIAYWFPHSGTWRGFAEFFVGDMGVLAGTLAGVAIFAASVHAVFRLPRRVRGTGFALLGPIWLLAPLLLATQEFPSYLFAKVLLLFAAPIFLVLCALALQAAGRSRLCYVILVAFIAVGSCIDVVRANGKIMRGEFKVRRVDIRSAGTFLELRKSDPGLIPFAVSEDELTNAWIAYRLRDVPLYLKYPEIGDRFLPAAAFECRRLPEGLARVCLLDADAAVVKGQDYPAYPKIECVAGVHSSAGLVWTGEGLLTFSVTTEGAVESPLHWFSFRMQTAEPGDAIAVVASGKASAISEGRSCSVPLLLVGGSQEVRFVSRHNKPFTLQFYGIDPARKNGAGPSAFTPLWPADVN